MSPPPARRPYTRRPYTRRIHWFKTVRIAILLVALLIVALTTWQEHYRVTRWHEPLFVAIYPIAGDESPVTQAYVAALNGAPFAAIDQFFSHEARRYGLNLEQPVRTRLKASLPVQPPQRAPQAGMLATALWSLKLRYWAWIVTRHAREPADVRIFVLYHDPNITPQVPHSLGLTKGLLGVVYAFAAPAMNGDNAVVIAHEFLHTVGATDKYDSVNDAPRFPDGYGDPRQAPLYPQATAEIMAGRRMVAADRWEQVAGLEQAVIGATTAREIHWRE